MEKQEIITDKAPKAIGPYSQGIKTGKLVFTSGQIPLDPVSGQIISGGIREQAEQVFKNLQAILEAGGASLNDVLKATVFLKDLNDFEELNSVYMQHFSQPYPARSCFEVSRLPKDVLVEIEAIAEVQV